MALLRNVATVGGYTMISRVFGFIRDAMTAAALGAGPVSDAFVVAQRLPNLFRSLFAEGAFNAAFVPIFARMIAEEGEDAAKIFAERVMSVLLAALLLMLIASEFFMPWVIPAIAAGFGHDSGELDFAAKLTRITFPYLLFISLVSLLGGVLNSVNRFGAVAFTPVLLNLFMIAAVLLGRFTGHVAEMLCWGITLSGIAQFLWLMISAARAGMALRLPWPTLGQDVRRFLTLMLPGVFGAGVTQINLLISTNVASMLPRGSLTYLYYADRLNQLPLAVIGIAVGTAILPPLSRQLREADGRAANETQNRGLELALLLTLPAAAALGVIAEPILSVLFQRGHFDAHAVHETAIALSAYALGLPAFVATKVLAPAFYARQDTRTPVKVGIVSVAANLALTLTLSIPLAHLGNALATTTAGWINALALAWLLRRRGHFAVDAQARRRVPRIIAASLAMGLLLFGMETLLHATLYGGPELLRIAALLVLTVGGLAAYGGFVLLFGAGRLSELKRLLGRRRKPA
jgi:putative peptidoglycan lipid II flippase